MKRQTTSSQASEQLITGWPDAPRLDSGSDPAIILRRAEGGPVTLSFAQERFWFLEQINPGDFSANIARGIRIKGFLQADVLERSLQALISRHESLRTTFATDQLSSVRDSKPVPLIAAERAVEISLEDLSAEPLHQREARARDLARRAAQRPFDLTLGPLLKVALLRLEEHEHILLLTLHRIVCDDLSLQILIDELWSAYTAFANQSAWPILPLQIQYADYAAGQRRLVEDERTKPALDFWRANLTGAPAVIELPTDRPRSPMRTWQGHSLRVEIEKELVDQIRVLAAGKGATLAMVLLSALKVVLARHSRQSDLVVGYMVNNRNAAETESLVGPLSNLLSLRTNLSGDPTFSELLCRVENNAREAQVHGFVPFEKQLEELQLEPSLSHDPVFQVSFSFREACDIDCKAAGLKLEEFDFDDGVARFDLTIDIFQHPSHLECRFLYNTDLFDGSTIERLAGHFKTVLQEIAANPEQRVSALPLLTVPERKQILWDWNNTKKDFGPAQSIPQLFEAQVDRTREATAVVFETEQLNYGELNRRANQLAHYLRKRGVGPEVLVGVCMKRSLDMVIGMLGILKAGGAYVPLDPAYPRERLRFMLEDSGARLLLTQKPLMNLIPEGSAELICLDSDWPEISKEQEENLAAKPLPENLAYVIYTSGSTGRPKGVAIEHRSAATLLSWARMVFTQEELRGVLASTSICFDLSVFELFAPLSNGGTVLLANDVLQLLSLPSAKDVSLINTVPSAMVELLRLDDLPENVQAVNLAGEPLHSALVDEIYKQPQIKRVRDLYGPSEDTTYSTFALRLPAGPATIGRPISNTRVYLLDQNLQPVPIGVPGEIHIGGAGLARCYLDRPELTACAFIPDPFSTDGSARLYKTGDLARYQADGKIEYLGRIDNQVKVRGYRIELGEIETVVSQHPNVRDVVVLAREDESGEKRLVAYVVPASKDCVEFSGNEPLQSKQISLWQAVWDETYRENAPLRDAGFNLVGWNSKY
ncbi:MAG TPA: amino acid adenylation domain-containing protein, partial [Pyrinomonadaceae bacterium]